MHTTAMVNDNLVLLAGDYDARLASRNMELVDLETLESTEITVRDYHPGPRFFLILKNYITHLLSLPSKSRKSGFGSINSNLQ